MANEEHLARLSEAIDKEDISIWNKWREENRGLKIELRDVDLSGAELREVDLRGVELRGADLNYTDLRDADLRDADLRETDLRDADLTNADLRDADLRDADLREANLRKAWLWGTKLKEADLRETKMIGTKLRRAKLNLADLRDADLRDADLSYADLSKANLNRVNLSLADLSLADLREADLREVDLREADLSLADLSLANLREADLSKANLREANLRNVNLGDAWLWGANLNEADLELTDFENVRMDRTNLGLTNLSTCKNLDAVVISGPCIIDFATLQASKPLPINFLRKLGLPDNYIEYLPDFFDNNPLKLFPVFLSHNHKDKVFARKLYDQLISHNVQVWFDEKRLRPGDRLHESISRSIDVYDKMILVCSENSLASWEVKKELKKLLAKEKKYEQEQGKEINLLIPITIDDKIFNWDNSLQSDIMEHRIGDFRGWENPEVFDRALKKLIDALNVDRIDPNPQSLLNI